MATEQISKFLSESRIKTNRSYSDKDLDNIINLILSRDFSKRNDNEKLIFINELINIIVPLKQLDTSMILYTLGKYMMDKVKILPEDEKLKIVSEITKLSNIPKKDEKKVEQDQEVKEVNDVKKTFPLFGLVGADKFEIEQEINKQKDFLEEYAKKKEPSMKKESLKKSHPGKYITKHSLLDEKEVEIPFEILELKNDEMKIKFYPEEVDNLPMVPNKKDVYSIPIQKGAKWINLTKYEIKLKKNRDDGKWSFKDGSIDKKDPKTFVFDEKTNATIEEDTKKMNESLEQTYSKWKKEFTTAKKNFPQNKLELWNNLMYSLIERQNEYAEDLLTSSKLDEFLNSDFYYNTEVADGDEEDDDEEDDDKKKEGKVTSIPKDVDFTSIYSEYVDWTTKNLKSQVANDKKAWIQELEGEVEQYFSDPKLVESLEKNV